uniref:Uncharacterized protein n=1 Tax=Triticum urartu TaxID=4572 RepID=A0A8R7P675_TRIUA
MKINKPDSCYNRMRFLLYLQFTSHYPYSARLIQCIAISPRESCTVFSFRVVVVFVMIDVTCRVDKEDRFAFSKCHST